MGRWKPHSHHGKVWVGITESPWEGGKHRVNTGRWKPKSQHEKVETIESPQKMETTD